MLATNSSDDQLAVFIGSKTKLASLKSLTIPRLELNAALLLARWLGRIKRVLDPYLKIVGTYAWLDRFNDSLFMVNGSKIVDFVDCQWNHIESANNPSDCASRGVMPSELNKLSLY